jgi:hypothetical protein
VIFRVEILVLQENKNDPLQVVPKLVYSVYKVSNPSVKFMVCRPAETLDAWLCYPDELSVSGVGNDMLLET